MLQGVFLKVLHKMDGPTAGYEIVMVQIEIAAGTLVPPHTHRASSQLTYSKVPANCKSSENRPAY